MRSVARKRKEKKIFKLPDEILNIPKIEMLGNKELIIDGCKGVVEYGENLIKLNTGELVMSIEGDEMLIKSFDSEIAVISGFFSGITFVS